MDSSCFEFLMQLPYNRGRLESAEGLPGLFIQCGVLTWLGDSKIDPMFIQNCPSFPYSMQLDSLASSVHSFLFRISPFDSDVLHLTKTVTESSASVQQC